MRYAAVVVAIILGTSGCQSSSETNYEEFYVGDVYLADFVGTWLMDMSDGVLRFDIRRGNDGRYFGYALAETLSPVTVLYENPNAFSTITGYWDLNRDSEWDRERDLMMRCLVITYGETLRCRYDSPTTGYPSEVRAERFGHGSWAQERPELASAPASFSPRAKSTRARDSSDNGSTAERRTARETGGPVVPDDRATSAGGSGQVTVAQARRSCGTPSEWHSYFASVESPDDDEWWREQPRDDRLANWGYRIVDGTLSVRQAREWVADHRSRLSSGYRHFADEADRWLDCMARL